MTVTCCDCPPPVTVSVPPENVHRVAVSVIVTLCPGCSVPDVCESERWRAELVTDQETAPPVAVRVSEPGRPWPTVTVVGDTTSFPASGEGDEDGRADVRVADGLAAGLVGDGDGDGDTDTEAEADGDADGDGVAALDVRLAGAEAASDGTMSAAAPVCLACASSPVLALPCSAVRTPITASAAAAATAAAPTAARVAR